MIDLFEPNPAQVQATTVPDGEWVYRPQFLAAEPAAQLMDRLVREIPWSLHKIRIFGRWVNEPRRTAWFGDPGAVYTYSGITMKPAPWTEELQRVRRAVESACDTEFNSVLLNLYGDGQDSMGWHADDEPELGRNPSIASLSLGAARRFCLKHRTLPDERREIPLAHGSLLLMKGALQHHWLHSLPKTTKVATPRLNLTFRKIIPV